MKIIILLLSIFVFVGCNKNNPSTTGDKPPTGLYIGDFFGNYSNNGVTYEKNLIGVQLKITETDKNHVLIGGASLVKNGKKIKGVLSINFYNGDLITIDGKWKKENGNYIIEGSFTSSYLFMNAQPPTTLPVMGTFRIESTF